MHDLTPILLEERRQLKAHCERINYDTIPCKAIQGKDITIIAPTDKDYQRLEA